jgi:hypothetical protein
MRNLLLPILITTFILQSCGGGSEGVLVVNNDPFNLRPTVEGNLIYKGELYSGKIIKYYDDGTFSKVEFEGSYLNGKRNGVWEWNHENGQLSKKGSYLNGEKSGVWEEHHENGQLSSKGSYLNGEKNGVWEVYYVNGQLFSKGSYLNGEEDGVWEVYHNNGQLSSKGSYLNGKKNGNWKYYNENGSLERTPLLLPDSLIEQFLNNYNQINKFKGEEGD